MKKALRYVAFAVGGYIGAFLLIFAGFALFDVSGWYIVYIPFLAILGAVVALFFVNYSSKGTNTSEPGN